MAKIFHRVVNADGIHQLAGIHAVIGVPESFELAEGLHEFRTEHLGQQSRAGLAVAVFAAERPTEAEHHIGGAFDELAEAAQSLDGAEVEVDPRVDAALSVVAIERASIAVLVHQGGDAAQIIAQLGGRDGSVLPALEPVGLAGHGDHGAKGGVADMPDAGSLFGGTNAGHGRYRPGLGGASERLRLSLGLFGCPTAHLDQQKAGAGR